MNLRKRCCDFLISIARVIGRIRKFVLIIIVGLLIIMSGGNNKSIMAE